MGAGALAMTDVVLIHPGATHGIYGELGNNLVAVEPPTWSRMIAGWLRDRGYIVYIIDQEAERLSSIEVAQRVLGYEPKITAIVVSGHQPSASSQQMLGASTVAKVLRSVGVNNVIMAGNHPSALPERTLREEAVTYVCDGEGPLTLAGLLAGDSLGSIPGLVWWEGTEVRKNGLAPLIPIDDLHGDVWDLLPMQKYASHNWQRFDNLSKRQPYASIYTTLGCPHKCSFCMINVFQHTNKYRRRDPTKVVDQISMLYWTYGVETLKIADEMFILSEAHYNAICDGIIERGLGDKLNIWAYARIDTVKSHTLAKLRQAGFKWLALGIESGSKHVRDGADKALKHDDIVATVRAIQAADINVIGNYIFGLPDDDAASMAETLALAMALNTEFANFYSAMAYPGSALYIGALAGGAILPATWGGYSQHNVDCRPLDTEHVSAKEVLAFRDAAFTTYFTNPAYLEMVERKFGAETLEHVKSMTMYKLPRKLLTGEIK